jgi:nitroimidazol reductase NimA-like FMN-containing flavoprotein (pyridoxamine 5'-phosphate oxidase superfamily)
MAVENFARAKVRRKDRANYDRAFVNAVLDECLVCHVGFVVQGQVYVIPTTYARVGETVYVHGAAASRLMKTLAEGIEVCVEVTILDGLVLAKSAFHHSMNYRSVVVFGRAREITDLDEKRRALDAIVEHTEPGRAAVARAPNAKELAATRVLAVPIEEASGKAREGGPIDDEEDRALDVWSGVIPVQLARLPRIAAS